MKILHCILIVIIINLSFLFPVDYAYLLENGVRQMGVCQPRVYGMKYNLEISTHHILFLIKPNIRMKKFSITVKKIKLGNVVDIFGGKSKKNKKCKNKIENVGIFEILIFMVFFFVFFFHRGGDLIQPDFSCGPD